MTLGLTLPWLTLPWLTLPIQAQPTEVRIDLADVATLAQFARAEQSARAGLWDEAVDALLRAGDLGGERLVPLPPESDIPHGRHFQRHITAHRLAHFQLAEIFRAHPETLRIYRRRVDPTAERLARDARDRHDAVAWEPLLRRYPLSTPAAAAWVRYGESQLELGNHHLARAAFESLHPNLRTPLANRPQAIPPAADKPVAKQSDSGQLVAGPATTSSDGLGASTPRTGQPVSRSLPRIPVGRSWWGTFGAAERLDEIAAFDAARDAAASLGSEPELFVNGKVSRSLPGLLTYPDGTWAEPDLLARLVATSILEGDRERAFWELERLRRLFPAAQGELQGRRGPWHELLAAWLDASRDWPQPGLSDTFVPAEQSAQAAQVEGTRPSSGWPQFAGGVDRRGRGMRVEDLAGRPRWSTGLLPVTIPSVDVAMDPLGGSTSLRDTFPDTAQRATSRPPDLLASFPVVSAGYLAVQDAQGVMVRRAATGETAFGVADDARLFANPLSPQWLAPRDARRIGLPRFPLAIDGGLLWACVGAPWQSFDRPRGGDLQPPRLIGLNLAAEGRAEASWSVAGANWGAEWSWEGPPVCIAARAYATLRRVDTVESQSHVACFDIATGRLRWRRLIAAAHSPRPARSLEWSRHLLTWHEDRLFVHADVGAVACLNPSDGAVEWLVRYPRVESPATGPGSGLATRELSPCVVDRGAVYVAAADQPGVFALEAATGQLMWASDSPMLGDCEYLLGIIDGQLLAGGRRLAWIDAATGRLRCQFPAESDADGPRGFGRGLVAAEEIWWPTRDRLLAFYAKPVWDGSRWRPRASRQYDLRARNAMGGNLAVADGMLFIAGPDRLYAFGP
ncbi:MAG: PQQ-binding-like beta-propeller repeat protein [Planctomycetota bacterium]